MREGDLLRDHLDGGSRALLDADAAAFAVIVVDFTLHGPLVHTDGEVRAELVAIGTE